VDRGRGPAANDVISFGASASITDFAAVILLSLFFSREATSSGTKLLLLGSFVLPAGESSKTLANFGAAIDALAGLGATRDCCVFALGGGVVGDLAAAMSHAPGKPPKPVPGVSPGAKQMGRAAAANILRRIAGQPTVPFRYADYGNLATIGRNSAVVDLGTPFGALRFSGRLAWLFWLFAHAYFLIGFRNRFRVMSEWVWYYFTAKPGAQLIYGRPRKRTTG
jgi:hypothetical protein